MSGSWDELAGLAERTGRPLDEIVRHHVLEGVLRRLSRASNAGDFVLRGSMLTRAWVAPRLRIADDLDFVGVFPYDVDDTTRRFASALAAAEMEDGVAIEVQSLRTRGIWLRTAFPGVRLSLPAGFGCANRTLQIDVGFNDPLVPPQRLMDYPTLLGLPTPLWAVRPETALAWKLHGLAEMGPQGWRPKDLHDLYLLVEAVPLEETWLPPAIEAAFVSRGYAPGDADVFTRPNWWELKSARVKWAEHRRTQAADDGADDLRAVIERVHTRVRPALQALGIETDKRERP